MENNIKKDIPFNCKNCRIFNLIGCYFNHDCVIEECVLNTISGKIEENEFLRSKISTLEEENSSLFREAFKMW